MASGDHAFAGAATGRWSACVSQTTRLGCSWAVGTSGARAHAFAGAATGRWRAKTMRRGDSEKRRAGSGLKAELRTIIQKPLRSPPLGPSAVESRVPWDHAFAGAATGRWSACVSETTRLGSSRTVETAGARETLAGTWMGRKIFLPANFLANRCLGGGRPKGRTTNQNPETSAFSASWPLCG